MIMVTYTIGLTYKKSLERITILMMFRLLFIKLPILSFCFGLTHCYQHNHKLLVKSLEFSISQPFRYFVLKTLH